VAERKNAVPSQQLASSRWFIAHGFGAELDAWGEKLNRPRTQREADSDYRVRLIYAIDHPLDPPRPHVAPALRDGRPNNFAGLVCRGDRWMDPEQVGYETVEEMRERLRREVGQ